MAFGTNYMIEMKRYLDEYASISICKNNMMLFEECIEGGRWEGCFKNKRGQKCYSGKIHELDFVGMEEEIRSEATIEFRRISKALSNNASMTKIPSWNVCFNECGGDFNKAKEIYDNDYAVKELQRFGLINRPIYSNYCGFVSNGLDCEIHVSNFLDERMYFPFILLNGELKKDYGFSFFEIPSLFNKDAMLTILDCRY